MGIQVFCSAHRQQLYFRWSILADRSSRYVGFAKRMAQRCTAVLRYHTVRPLNTPYFDVANSTEPPEGTTATLAMAIILPVNPRVERMTTGTTHN